MNVSARVTLDTEFFCWCYAVQPQDFSCCRIRVTLDTVYHCRCYVCIHRNDYEVAGLAAGGTSGNTSQTASVVESAVPLLTNNACYCRQMQICTQVQQLCIRLNSSKIHTSNNNLAACAAPFIPPHSSQLWIQRMPISFLSLVFSTLSALSISHAVHSAHAHAFLITTITSGSKDLTPLITWILLTCP